MTPKNLAVEAPLVSIDDLTPFPGNPRHGDLESIKDSIAKNGFYNPLVVQKSTGHIIVGNHRYLAAKELGFSEVPTLKVDVNDTEARRILIADNATTDKAVNDDMAVARIIRAIQEESDDLAGLGFDKEEAEDYVKLAQHADRQAEILAQAAAREEETAPVVPQTVEPRVTPGAPTPGVTPDITPAPASVTPTFEAEARPTAPPANPARRPMILDLPLEVYAWLTSRIEDINIEQDTTTNIEAILHAVAVTTGTTAPNLTSDDRKISDPDTDGVGQVEK